MQKPRPPGGGTGAKRGRGGAGGEGGGGGGGGAKESTSPPSREGDQMGRGGGAGDGGVGAPRPILQSFDMPRHDRGTSPVVVVICRERYHVPGVEAYPDPLPLLGAEVLNDRRHASRDGASQFRSACRSAGHGLRSHPFSEQSEAFCHEVSSLSLDICIARMSWGRFYQNSFLASRKPRNARRSWFSHF